MSEVAQGLEQLEAEDNAGAGLLGEGEENLLWKPQNVKVISNHIYTLIHYI